MTIIATSHLEHFATRVIHVAGLGVRLAKRMNELADVLLEVSSYISPEHKIKIGERGERVSLMIEELRETSLVLNDDFKEVVENDLKSSKRIMELIIEVEGLKYKLAQVEKDKR